MSITARSGPRPQNLHPVSRAAQVSAPENTARPQEAMLRRIAAHCAAYQGASASRSIGQVGLSFGIYFALMAGSIAAVVNGAAWLSLLIAPVAGLMLVKLFTIQHDCGHGSYFATKRANDALGFFISILTFTPYGFWRDSHNRHHASSGNLTRRGVGAVDTLTVEEYRALGFWRRSIYRLYRHPAMMILFGAPFYFLIVQRLPLTGAMPFAEVYHGLKFQQIWRSILALDIALLVVYGLLALTFGPLAVLIAVAPVVSVAAIVGVWLFFVQHQYEDAYWRPQQDWSYAEAAVFGSSHYDLPQPLQWVTGNIGLHHIHHLSSRIPNYRLQECYNASPDLRSLPRLTFAESLKCAQLALWDEARGKMVTFRAALANEAQAAV